MSSRRGTLIFDEDDSVPSDDQDEMPGARYSWGQLIKRNPDSTSSYKHPFMCSLEECTHKYSKSSANATKVGWRICAHTGHCCCCPQVHLSLL